MKAPRPVSIQKVEVFILFWCSLKDGVGAILLSPLLFLLRKATPKKCGVEEDKRRVQLCG